MRSFNADFPPWRCSGRQRRKGERRRHPLGNKPWKKELHHQDEPWIRSLEGCFNGGKERGRERERGEHEIEGIKKRERSATLKYVSQDSHSSKLQQVLHMLLFIE